MVRRFALAALVALVCAPVLEVTADQAAQPVFTVAFAASARPEAVTGRVYVAISRVNAPQSPIRQAGPTGAPLFSVPVDQLATNTEAGDAADFSVKKRLPLPRAA